MLEENTFLFDRIDAQLSSVSRWTTSSIPLFGLTLLLWLRTYTGTFSEGDAPPIEGGILKFFGVDLAFPTIAGVVSVYWIVSGWHLGRSLGNVAGFVSALDPGHRTRAEIAIGTHPWVFNPFATLASGQRRRLAGTIGMILLGCLFFGGVSLANMTVQAAVISGFYSGASFQIASVVVAGLHFAMGGYFVGGLDSVSQALRGEPISGLRGLIIGGLSMGALVLVIWLAVQLTGLG